MKYITFQSPLQGEFPVVFPDGVEHSFIASSVNARYPGVKPISAGFCSINGTDVSVWGKSNSLNLEYDAADYRHLERLFGITRNLHSNV